MTSAMVKIQFLLTVNSWSGLYFLRFYSVCQKLKVHSQSGKAEILRNLCNRFLNLPLTCNSQDIKVQTLLSRFQNTQPLLLHTIEAAWYSRNSPIHPSIHLLINGDWLLITKQPFSQFVIHVLMRIFHYCNLTVMLSFEGSFAFKFQYLLLPKKWFFL